MPLSDLFAEIKIYNLKKIVMNFNYRFMWLAV